MKIWRINKYKHPDRVYKFTRCIGPFAIVLFMMAVSFLSTWAILAWDKDYVIYSSIPLLIGAVLCVYFSITIAKKTNGLAVMYIEDEYRNLFQVDGKMYVGSSNPLLSYLASAVKTAEAIAYMYERTNNGVLRTSINALGSVIPVEELISIKPYRGGKYCVCVTKDVNEEQKSVTLLVDGRVENMPELEQAFERKRRKDSDFVPVNHAKKIWFFGVLTVVMLAITCCAHPAIGVIALGEGFYMLFMILFLVALFFFLLFFIKNKRGER